VELKFSKQYVIKVGLLVQYSSKETILERFDQLSTLKNYLENQNFEMFEEVVRNFTNFSKSDDIMIYWKNDPIHWGWDEGTGKVIPHESQEVHTNSPRHGLAGVVKNKFLPWVA
jgi:hypothetical protein